MSRKQLLLLFLGSLVVWTVGGGLMPILPVYALGLGASEAITGYYLAFAFLALAVGSICSGWLADKFQRRKLQLILSAVMMVPFVWLQGQATNVWQLALASAAVWLSIGIAGPVITIIAGLFADKNERGKILGLIGITSGLGAIIGGLTIGPMIDRWGYPTMFTALSIFSTVLLISAVFVKDKKVKLAQKKADSVNRDKLNFGKAFYMLLLAQLIVLTINSLTSMGRSVSMNNLGFAATALTSTAVISGLVSLPVPFVLGWLSDRLGRKSMMVICYLANGFCMIMLAFSTSLWHFWIVLSFYRISMVSRIVGAAFVTDLVEPRALGRGVALFQCVGWIAFTIGFVIAGNAFQTFGIKTTSLVGTSLPIIGIILMLSIRAAKQKLVVAQNIDE